MHLKLTDLLRVLIVAYATIAFGHVASAQTVRGAAIAQLETDALLDDIEQRTFRFFWEVADPANGLMRDRYPTPSFVSVAAVGFALASYAIGAERGYVTRDEARQRVLTTLRFFDNASMGPEAAGRSGYRGFFYHFLDANSGARFQTVELSTVDTALLLAGMLVCQSYFDRSGEEEIGRLVESIYGRIDWTWAQARGALIAHGWKPESGFLPYDWDGYNEAMLVYILALGSATHAVDPQAWTAWSSTYPRSWGTWYGQQHLGFGPMFGHQYSQLWIDFRGIQDAFMREHGMDYFENSRRAVLAQQGYARANPMGWKGYAADMWGFSASDGPADVTLRYRGHMRRFWTYAGRGAPSFPSYDDGTIAPTAVAGSLPFAPEIVIPTLRAMLRRYGDTIYGRYGFIDAFNPSFLSDVPLHHGRRVGDLGWVAGDYLGIDQGPIVAMIENHRSGLIWKVLRNNAHVRTGLERAGFSGGWLDVSSQP